VREQGANNADARPQRDSVLARIGIPPPLLFGYVGLLLFMVGDGVESGYLSPYLVSYGISTGNVALIFTLYGGMVALAGWLSGALSDAWGPQRVVALGFILWLLFQVAFLTLGLGHGYMFLLITYALRGLGYPLFAFGFLVWITVIAPKARLSSAMGWFWFAFTGGLPTLGSVVASWCLPRFGPIGTLWVATGFVAAGGSLLLVGVREPLGRRRLVPQEENPIAAIGVSISLLWRKPKTAIACVVRIINTAPQFGFLVFLPAFFVQQMGFSLTQWLHLLSAIFLSNIIWNLLFGLLADRLGWVRTVAICGGFGCTLTTLGIYYVPVLTHSFAASVLVGVLYGATLAAYVPLSALMPSLALQDKGASLSLLSLGAGASVWVGPAMVGLLLHPLGVKGLMWVFAMLYLLSGILAFQLGTTDPVMEYPPKQEVADGMAFH
jgi:polyol permease family